MFWFFFIATIPLWSAVVYRLIYKTSVYQNQQSKKRYLFICCTMLFLMIGLRHYSLGSVDSQNYYNNWIRMRGSTFAEIEEFTTVSDIESGYLYTIGVLSKILYYPQFLFVLTGLLFTAAMGTFVYHNSKDIVLSMLFCICLGLYGFMIQGLRQSISISICLFSVEYIKKRKLKPFLLLILLAYCFHRSCVVFALSYFLYGSELNNNTKLKYIGIALLLLLLSPFLQDTGNALLDRNYEDEASTDSAWVAAITYLIILVISYAFLSKKNTNKNSSFFVGITTVGSAFFMLRYTQTQAFERISYYFLAGQAIVLPEVLRLFDPKSRKLLTLLAVVLSVALFIYRTRASYATQYLFFWQG